MTKKQQIEELARLILIRMGWAGSRLLDAKETAEAIWDNDWRKVEKPPVLTDNQIGAILARDWDMDESHHYPTGEGSGVSTSSLYKNVAQAQRDADYLAMRGEE